jgi:hypothetical protein
MRREYGGARREAARGVARMNEMQRMGGTAKVFVPMVASRAEAQGPA